MILNNFYIIFLFLIKFNVEVWIRIIFVLFWCVLEGFGDKILYFY